MSLSIWVCILPLDSAAQLNLSRASGSAINQALNQINWLPHEIQQLEDILLASNQSVYCYGPVSAYHIAIICILLYSIYAIIY